MQPANWTSDVWQVAKTAMPWVTGGLAGSVLTNLLAQRVARKSRARLSIRTSTVRFSLPTVDSGLKSMQVRYGGEDFETLSLYELTAVNISSQTVSAAPFLLQFQDPSRIVDINTSVQPVNRVATWSRQESTREVYLWDPGELKPTDSARLQLLLAPTTVVTATFRGDDNIDVISDSIKSPATDERYVREFVAWAALYVALGFIPFLSSLLRGVLIWGSIPLAVILVGQVKNWFGPRNSIQIGELRAEEVSIDTGTRYGSASVR